MTPPDDVLSGPSRGRYYGKFTATEAEVVRAVVRALRAGKRVWRDDSQVTGSVFLLIGPERIAYVDDFLWSEVSAPGGVCNTPPQTDSFAKLSSKATGG